MARAKKPRGSQVARSLRKVAGMAERAKPGGRAGRVLRKVAGMAARGRAKTEMKKGGKIQSKGADH